MKKTICMLLIMVLAVGALAGCGKEAERESPLTAQNEILTYQRIDPSKTQIVVSRTGNIELSGICDGFEQANPDVQVIRLDLTGGSQDVKPAVDWVKNGYAPDVVISAGRFFPDEDLIKYFENLSADPIIERYEADALARAATDANIYWLPGPSDVNAMTYNKTLFERYGWTVPNTFDEFVALCQQIRSDTDGQVEPWNPNAKYTDELLVALEAFVYEELLGGADNRAWYNDFVNGKASFTGHMEPYYNMVQTLVDNGILREEHFSYSATTRGKEFVAGQIAMINGVATNKESDEFEFGYFPFPTTKGEMGYINDTFSYLVGVPKKARTEKVQDAINRFIQFMSTPEGQALFIGNSLKMSNVKGASINQSAGLSTLKSAIEAGHLFAMLNFAAPPGQVKRNVPLYEDARDMVAGTKTVAECIAAVDAAPSEPTENKEPEAKPEVAVAEKDFSMLETSFYIADAYRETMDADIGLISHGVAYRGNLMRIFHGDISSAFNTVLKPRSFENDSKLVKVSMTGQQLLDALNEPPDYGDVTADAVYAFSGLVCQIAPWNPLGEKYLSVKLADGTQIDAKKQYTVAVWDGTIGNKYVTEILEAYDGSFEDLMTAKMKADGTLTPANDGRVTLIWD